MSQLTSSSKSSRGVRVKCLQWPRDGLHVMNPQGAEFTRETFSFHSTHVVPKGNTYVGLPWCTADIRLTSLLHILKPHSLNYNRIQGWECAWHFNLGGKEAISLFLLSKKSCWSGCIISQEKDQKFDWYICVCPFFGIAPFKEIIIKFILFLKDIIWMGEMAHLVKHLPHNHKNLSSKPKAQGCHVLTLAP